MMNLLGIYKIDNWFKNANMFKSFLVDINNPMPAVVPPTLRSPSEKLFYLFPFSSSILLTSSLRLSHRAKFSESALGSEMIFPRHGLWLYVGVGGWYLGGRISFRSLTTSRGERRRWWRREDGKRVLLRCVEGVADCGARVAGGCTVVIWSWCDV